MKVNQHFHLKAQAEVPPELLTPLIKALRTIDVDWTVQTGTSIRATIVATLRSQGWPKPVKLDSELGITVTAMKAGTALCIQFGNVARFYADLLKLEYLHQKSRASGAIYILPMKSSAKKVGDNLANFERLSRELAFFQDIIRIPIVVIGLED